MRSEELTFRLFGILSVLSLMAVPIVVTSCSDDEVAHVEVQEDLDSLGTIQSRGISSLISDSGIVSYRIIAEEWKIYDKKDPSYWSYEKGLFMEKYDKSFHVDLFVNCDTAYYYDDLRLWELRGRVTARNTRGETFRTSKLFWDGRSHKIYSDRYIEIIGIDRQLSGYDFYSNEDMTEYEIHSSHAKFPVSDEGAKPHPDPETMSEMRDMPDSPERTSERNSFTRSDSLSNVTPSTPNDSVKMPRDVDVEAP